jgi:hypothetical protein
MPVKEVTAKIPSALMPLLEAGEQIAECHHLGAIIIAITGSLPALCAAYARATTPESYREFALGLQLSLSAVTRVACATDPGAELERLAREILAVDSHSQN